MGNSRALAGALAFCLLLSLTRSAWGEESARPRRTEFFIDGALTAAWLAMMPAMFVETRATSRIGPSVRGPEDVEALEAALAQGRLDQPFHDEETVSDGALVGISAGLSLGALALVLGVVPWIDDGDQDGRWFGEQILSSSLGMFHAIFGAYVMTELAKVTAGRLRPDFADRADRVYCHQEPIHEAYRPRCESLEASGRLGPPIEEEELTRGRRSFWSGHSSMSFAAATYSALLIGGRMVWGERSTSITRAIGVLLQGAAMATAGFIASSRVSDGVHHADDVVVGSLVGITTACLGYFLHFDLSGEVRRGASLSVAPQGEGASLAVIGSF